MTDPTTRIRERLMEIVAEAYFSGDCPSGSAQSAADAIMREFALRPVAQGVVDSESGEVAPRA